MVTTIPNKEVVRRICKLHGANDAWMLVDFNNDFIEILAHVRTHELMSLKTELEVWGGMKFKVINMKSNHAVSCNIQTNGVRILPIQL